MRSFRSLGRQKRTHLERVRRLVGSKFQVVFCTNSYVTHLYMPSERHYGPAALVVSDENSQATRWSTLGAAAAVRLSGRLVLIGDQDQLGPVYSTDTTNDAAAWTLMDELFPRLPEEAKVTLTVQYRSHPAVMSYATNHIYADLWSAPRCLNRPIPPGIAWPLRDITERDAAVCSTAPPGSTEEWRRAPTKWLSTPLPPDAVTPAAPAEVADPPPQYLAAARSHDYFALAIDTDALQAGCAPPRPGNARGPATPAAASRDASPPLPASGPGPEEDSSDWTADPPPDPRPLGSRQPVRRELVPHPCAFLHVDA